MGQIQVWLSSELPCRVDQRMMLKLDTTAAVAGTSKVTVHTGKYVSIP